MIVMSRTSAKTHKQVKIVEVGPRDGLQNEKQTIEIETKLALIEGLAGAGLRHIEVGSFVSPKWVPQMADSDEVYRRLVTQHSVCYPVLVPNDQGFKRALAAGVTEISCFTSASDAFNRKNINCNIDESLRRIATLVHSAKAHHIKVRAYVSCVAGCPYQGEVAISEVRRVCDALLAMGCYEISLGDTIGVGTPNIITDLLGHLTEIIDIECLALHLHDTYGQALANIYAGLAAGIRIFDSSVAGLGGCPYAIGASGNVATEDVVYMLNGLGFDSGVHLEKLVHVGDKISKALNRRSQSKVAQAMLAHTDKASTE